MVILQAVNHSDNLLISYKSNPASRSAPWGQEIRISNSYSKADRAGITLETAPGAAGAQAQVQQKRSKTNRRRFVRWTLIGINGVILVGVLAIVLLGQRPGGGSTAHVLAASASGDSTTLANPLDQVSSADIAVNVARAGALPESTAVVNQADSVNMELAMAPASTSIVSKPAVVTTALKSKKDIKTYVTVTGDTVSGIASKFNVTSDSIRWSNNISGDSIKAGVTLYIPPESGIVYTVKAGDTPDSLAAKFKASKDEIVAANDAELAGLKVGDRILIPGGTQPAPAPVQVATASFGWGGTAVYGFNGYDYGYCTWYVANRRAELGHPVPANLGDAYTWATRAAAAGIATGSEPRNGAVAVKHSYAPGHVAVVEQVNADGSFWISEMNSSGQRSMADPAPSGGWGHIDWKIIPASEVGNWTYIYN